MKNTLKKTRKNLACLFTLTALGSFYSATANAAGDAVEIHDPEKSANSLVATSVAIAGDYSLMGAPVRTSPGQDPGGAYIYINGNSTHIQALSIPSASQTVNHQTFTKNNRTGKPTPGAIVDCSLTKAQVDGAELGRYTAMSDEWVALSANMLGYGSFGASTNCVSGSVIPTIFLAKADSNFKSSSSQPYSTLDYSVSIPYDKPVKAMAISDTDLVVIAPKGAHVYSYNNGTGWTYSTTLLQNRSLGGSYPHVFNNDFRYHPVAIDGNRMVLGDASAKKVYVFEKQNNNWVQIASTPTSTDHQFGRAVDIDGNHIIVAHNNGVRFYQITGSSILSQVAFNDPGNFGNPTVVGISTGERHGVNVKRAIAWYPDPTSCGNCMGGRTTYELDTSINTFISGFYNIGSTNQDSDGHWEAQSAAMDGNSVVIGSPTDRFSVSKHPSAGRMFFDRFDHLFHDLNEPITSVDDAESDRLWFNGGEFNWLRHTGSTPSGRTGPTSAGINGGKNYYYVETSASNDISTTAPGYEMFKWPNYGEARYATTPYVFPYYGNDWYPTFGSDASYLDHNGSGVTRGRGPIATLRSGDIVLTPNTRLEFNYHTKGANIGKLTLEYRDVSSAGEYYDRQWKPTGLVNISGDSNGWQKKSNIDIGQLAGNILYWAEFRLVYTKTSKGYQGDIAVDNIKIIQ